MPNRTTLGRTRTLVATARSVLFTLAAVFASAPPSLAQPAAVVKLDRLSADATPAQAQRAFYDAFVANGVPPSIAALLTVETAVVERDDEHIKIVQTMVGGGRRELDVTVRSGASTAKNRVPFLMEDGTVGLAENVTSGATSGGYGMSTKVYVPPESVTPDLLDAAARDRGLEWLELLGISAAHAQAGGLVGTMSDSFSGPSANQAGAQSLLSTADSVVSSLSSELPKMAQDVASALEPATEGPKTLWQHRADIAKSGAKVLDHAGKVAAILQDHKAREAKLRALQDCAENPTAPTARDAQRTDPNYRRATTDVISTAQAELTINTAIRIVAATVNGGAQVLLGSSRGKLVSLANKVEDKLLKHVADEYIMKDAGKGVVPCEPDCSPRYVPEPPPEQLASYPPDELTCSTADPAQLVCQAAPPGSGPSFTPGPPWVPSPANPPPPAPTCRTLTSAEFTFRYQRESAGCVQRGFCAADTEARDFTANVALRFDDGYEGEGPGVYRESFSRAESAPTCSQSSSGETGGTPSMRIDVLASIDTDVVGGIDTGGLPADTSVAEVFVEGSVLQSSESRGNCYTPAESSNPTDVGFDCHFYGVELYRPGFYRVYKDNDPASGVCALTLR